MSDQKRRRATPSPGRCQKKNRNEGREPVKVSCRLRPISSRNRQQISISAVNKKLVKLTAPKGYFNRNGQTPADCLYKFSRVFDSNSSQTELFNETTHDLIEDLIKAKDGLIFTYGVTGSGKTYTMTGKPGEDGILPRSLDILFNSINGLKAEKYQFVPDGQNGFSVRSQEEKAIQRVRMNLGYRRRTPRNKPEFKPRNPDERKAAGTNEDMLYSVFVSYIEIYNNFVFDLLEPIMEGDKIKSKKLREHQKSNVFVENVVEIEVGSMQEAFEQFIKGQEQRRVAETQLNDHSSRSHSVFNIRLIMVPVDASGVEPVRDKQQVHVSQLSLVDLAGSERSKRTENMGERLAESGKINQSLMTLRQCIEQLRKNQRRRHGDQSEVIPYRESKLTHLFKNYFEGEGKVRMIVCVNPSSSDYDENMFVMKFAKLTQDVEIQRATAVEIENDQPVSRRRFAQWQREVDEHLDGFPITPSSSLIFESVPSKLFHSDIIRNPQSITQLRKLVNNNLNKRAEYMAVADTKTTDFDALYRHSLCLSDRNQQKVEESMQKWLD